MHVVAICRVHSMATEKHIFSRLYGLTRASTLWLENAFIQHVATTTPTTCRIRVELCKFSEPRLHEPTCSIWSGTMRPRQPTQVSPEIPHMLSSKLTSWIYSALLLPCFVYRAYLPPGVIHLKVCKRFTMLL